MTDELFVYRLSASHVTVTWRNGVKRHQWRQRRCLDTGSGGSCDVNRRHHGGHAHRKRGAHRRHHVPRGAAPSMALRRRRISAFLVNLAVGDLLVCVVTMTTEILFVAFGQWVLGPAGCKLVVYGQIVTLASTTFLLTAMSIDSYQVYLLSQYSYHSECELQCVAFRYFSSTLSGAELVPYCYSYKRLSYRRGPVHGG